MRTKGSDLLVAALENEGVERIFGLPGEENLAVVESLRQSKIELVLTRHEQAASFMAATQGRFTGSPGVCLSTLGPGALNFTTGAAYAYLGAMPMVLITGQKAIKSAFLKSSFAAGTLTTKFLAVAWACILRARSRECTGAIFGLSERKPAARSFALPCQRMWSPPHE